MFKPIFFPQGTNWETFYIFNPSFQSPLSGDRWIRTSIHGNPSLQRSQRETPNPIPMSHSTHIGHSNTWRQELRVRSPTQFMFGARMIKFPPHALAPYMARSAASTRSLAFIELTHSAIPMLAVGESTKCSLRCLRIRSHANFAMGIRVSGMMIVNSSPRTGSRCPHAHVSASLAMTQSPSISDHPASALGCR